MKGCLEYRGKGRDGLERWRFIVTLGRDAEGKLIQVKESFQGKKTDAQTELARFVAKIADPQYVAPAKETLGSFFDRWCRDYGEVNLAPKTLFRYKEIFDSRIRPALGEIKIEKITPGHLMQFYRNLQKDGVRADGKPGGLSEQSIRHHHRLLSAVLQDAVEWQVITSNPAARVKAPKVSKKKAACYDEEQTLNLLLALDKEPFKYKVMINLLLATGFRRGEAMGLEWRHINFENNTIEIEQASQYVKGIGTFTKGPKNETSKRVVTVPAQVMLLLKQYKKDQNEQRLKLGDMWNNSERLFTTWDGAPAHPDSLSKWFPLFLKRHGLPHLPLHGLRHTAATLLIGQGLHAKVISSRLGHSNISTTMDIYGHYLKSADKEAADKLEHIFTKQVKNN